MSRFVVFLAIALTVAASDTVDVEKCKKVLNSHRECCEIPLIDYESISIQDKMRCLSIPEAPGSDCEIAVCLLSKLGFVTDDGVINNDVWQKKIEEKLSDHKDILEHMKKQCFDDRYKSFRKSDDCDLNKIVDCISWQYVFSCPGLSNKDTCIEVRDIAPKCLELQA